MFNRKTPIRDALFILSFLAIFYVYWDTGPGGNPAATDIYAFHLVGRLIWQGDILKAYSNSAMRALQAADLGTAARFFVWPYPLQFDLVAAVLGLFPLAVAYLVFIGTTYAAYLAVLWKLAGKATATVLGLVLPSIIVTICAGQNGFLTASLVGAFVMLFARRRGWAGIALGLMIIKPHLALGLGVLVLVKRRWDILGVALATVIATSVLCALIFGPEAWLAFLANAREQGRLMAAGDFPMYRMTSVYATLRTFGIGAPLAAAAQLAVAAAAIGMIVLGQMRGYPERVVLAFAVMATLAISPYVYDYDMPMFGIGVALVLPELMHCARRTEWIALHLCIWIATTTGLLYAAAAAPAPLSAVPALVKALLPRGFMATPAGVFYLAAIVIAVAIVRRALRQGAGTVPEAMPAAGTRGPE